MSIAIFSMTKCIIPVVDWHQYYVAHANIGYWVTYASILFANNGEDMKYHTHTHTQKRGGEERKYKFETSTIKKEWQWNRRNQDIFMT